MKCEFSDGSMWTVSDAASLEERIRSLRDDEHIILSHGDIFIQAAAGGGTFDLQYGDGATLYTADEPVQRDQVIQSFVAFFNGDEGWRSSVQWSGEGTGGGFNRPEGSSDRSTNGPAGQSKKNLAEQLLDDAKGALKNKTRRALRNGLRKFLG